MWDGCTALSQTACADLGRMLFLVVEQEVIPTWHQQKGKVATVY